MECESCLNQLNRFFCMFNQIYNFKLPKSFGFCERKFQGILKNINLSHSQAINFLNSRANIFHDFKTQIKTFFVDQDF